MRTNRLLETEIKKGPTSLNWDTYSRPFLDPRSGRLSRYFVANCTPPYMHTLGEMLMQISLPPLDDLFSLELNVGIRSYYDKKKVSLSYVGSCFSPPCNSGIIGWL